LPERHDYHCFPAFQAVLFFFTYNRKSLTYGFENQTFQVLGEYWDIMRITILFFTDYRNV